MNDHRLPSDELASAFLDGELTDAEAEAVRQDPELAARAAELRQTVEAFAETPTPPPGAAETAVEAALADFDARRLGSVREAQGRPRRLTLITGVAAAIAVGFIVAAAVGLFAEREDTPQQATAIAAPAAAPEPAAAGAAAMEPPADVAMTPPPDATPAPPAAPEPAAAMAPDGTTVATMLPPPAIVAAAADEAAPAPAIADEAAPAPSDADEAALSEALAALAEVEAELAEAQAAGESAREEAAAAQAEAEAAREVAAPPPAAVVGEDLAADETADAEAGDGDAPAGPPTDMPADPTTVDCVAAVGDGVVELHVTTGATRLLVVRTAGGAGVVLDATTCEEIPPDEPAESAPAACAVTIGDGSVEFRFTVDGAALLLVRGAGGESAILDATTCEGIPPE